MIERLNQLSLEKFIELSCGDYTILRSDDEVVPDAILEEQASRLLLEYKRIINPNGVRAMILEKEEYLKLAGKIFLLKLCESVCALEGYDDVRKILDTLTYVNKADDQLEAYVKALLAEAEYQKKRNDFYRKEEQGTMKVDEIRASFDIEIAFIMTYYKMPIDIRSTNAAVYANIVHQVDIEMSNKMRSQ